MIVKMKHLDILCVAAEKEAALEALRGLGAVHLDLARAQGAEVLELKGEIADAEKAVHLIEKMRKELKKDAATQADSNRGAAQSAAQAAEAGEKDGVKEALALAARRETLGSEADALEREIAKYEPFGDFDSALAQKLLDLGIDLNSVAELPEKLPPKRLSEMQADLDAKRGESAALAARIAAIDVEAIKASFPGLADALAFGAAKELLAEHGAVVALAGWIPAPKVEEFKGAVAKNGWGVLVRDPAEGETPPTLVEPPKLFRPMKALFDGLGVTPGYTEADVSVPFMCYFALFFAMLVGDAAYGLIFLIGTIAMRKKLPGSWVKLITVFSIATVVWGTLNNTWFGANIPMCKEWAVVKWLADPSYNNIMLLCFTIGVSHLMLARLWNAACLFPDSTAIAQLGWAGVLLFMYLVTNSIIGIFPGIPTWAYYMFGASLVALFGFTVKPSELKTRGAEVGMLPLNIMSALGDIISYVRLFAVGLAGCKVAENFNSMATGLISSEHSLWLNALMCVVMAAILVIGHALNLAMAGLSILVHAVRLNTLEFSNHKGVSWSGYAWRPFKKHKS